MNAFLRTQLPTLALALLAAGALYWFLFQDDPLSVQKNSGAINTQTIDFYVENARSHRFLADGSLDYQLHASQLRHVQASDVTLVTQPQLSLHRGNPQPWHISSGRAEVAPGGRSIALLDNVTITRTDSNGRPLRLETAQLSVFPQQEYMTTSAPVRIETATGVTTAVGMDAFFKDKNSRVLLHSKVRGQHEIR